MSELDNVLKLFDPISLKEMDRVKLLNRVDTKYVFDISTLIKVLPEISTYYFILEIDGKRTNSYQTLYFDTANFDSYIQHQNGKLNRTKIRFRKYIESDLNFLEIKFKNNKERTIKNRIKAADIETVLSTESSNFINENSKLNPNELSASLWNSFTRITLTHKTINERLTIDLNLGFKNNKTQEETSIPHIVIAELKQGKANVGSDFVKIIKKQHVRPMGMSKYCIGTALLNKQLKSNNFKERILKINKLKHA
ncbi:polyphosphate polymerase domain-containing protein [Vicingus serpentipes]|uniref:Polyphosphate polymerase domain-containing protein n=1 Tax=Vicingus serpentipes TaxID=1926625 RepID=A0A5C6RZD9_9FLAO|nr:polyphosphate polymerase domain-containing protein [Vicingus serpentipes]TXB66742.1 polyphosphate polymerase domain-containing protein [Vicingus serpentipes]